MIFALTIFIAQAVLNPLPKVEQAMLGTWIGTLEYRDYSNDSRERLPTLLRVSRVEGGSSVAFRYVYDDGPNKVVQDKDIISVDEAKSTYSIQSPDGKSKDDYEAKTLRRLRPDGTGKLILFGKATENGAAVEIRETITIERLKLDILRESKLPGEPFKFRHEYAFTRVDQPKAK